MSDLERSHAPITMALFSRNHLLRLGLQAGINTQQHIRLIGEASSAWDAKKLLARETPQSLVIEMEPELDIMELVRTVKTFVPTIRIIALSDIEDTARMLGALASGVDGIVLTIQPAVVLLATIDYLCRLQAGTGWHARSEIGQLERHGTAGGRDGARPIAPQYPDRSLTEREQEIVLLVGQALSNKDIADRLYISSTTVRHHLTSIFDKLGVTSRQKLLIRALQHGLVEFRALA